MDLMREITKELYEEKLGYTGKLTCDDFITESETWEAGKQNVITRNSQIYNDMEALASKIEKEDVENIGDIQKALKERIIDIEKVIQGFKNIRPDKFDMEESEKFLSFVKDFDLQFKNKKSLLDRSFTGDNEEDTEFAKEQFIELSYLICSAMALACGLLQVPWKNVMPKDTIESEEGNGNELSDKLFDKIKDSFKQTWQYVKSLKN